MPTFYVHNSTAGANLVAAIKASTFYQLPK